MNATLKPDNKWMRAKATGEPMVWFTGMGLAVGLLMILGLLTLIVSQGISVFWPRDIIRIELKPGSTSGIKDGLVLGGEVNRKQKKYVPRVLDAAGRTVSDQDPPMEWQLFTGNRDAYGFSFKYTDQQQFADISEPKNAILIERLEYGDAVGQPVSLTLPDSSLIEADADQAAFDGRLKSLVKEGNKRRANILNIEKKKIGAINASLQQLQIQKRQAEMDEKWNEALATEQESKRAALQVKFEQLDVERKALRAEQEKGSLQIRLFTGEERSIPLGQILYFYFPNRAGLGEKAGIFLHNIWSFVSTDPREANTEGGIFPAIFGTFVMTMLMSLAVTPFGVIAAIYLREYAKQGIFVRSVRIAVNNLAGVPSIVFGVFGLGFFVYVLGANIDGLFFKASLPTPTFGTGGIFWASLTLALMTVPVVIVSTEEALAAVPRGMREASLACGGSKWQTIQRIVLPASSSGILTGLILAMARGAGEVAPLMLVGVVKLAPTLAIDSLFPFVHLDRKFMHLGFHIYDLGFQSPDSEAAKPMVFATTLLLIVLVVVLNLTAIMIRERLRRKYATGAF